MPYEPPEKVRVLLMNCITFININKLFHFNLKPKILVLPHSYQQLKYVGLTSQYVMQLHSLIYVYRIHMSTPKVGK